MKKSQNTAAAEIIEICLAILVKCGEMGKFWSWNWKNRVFGSCENQRFLTIRLLSPKNPPSRGGLMLLRHPHCHSPCNQCHRSHPITPTPIWSWHWSCIDDNMAAHRTHHMPLPANTTAAAKQEPRPQLHEILHCERGFRCVSCSCFIQCWCISKTHWLPRRGITYKNYCGINDMLFTFKVPHVSWIAVAKKQLRGESPPATVWPTDDEVVRGWPQCSGYNLSRLQCINK